MSNRGRIVRECEYLNRKRNVFEGSIDNRSFFQNIRGDLLVSGESAGEQEMILNLVESCLEKADMPIILLSGHPGVFTELQRRRTRGVISNVRIASPSEKTYQPFLGMSKQQIQRFVSIAAEKMGIGVLIGKVMIYTAALLDIVAAKYPVSLPAMTGLLEEDDDVISEVAMECGLSNVVVDNIRSNHEAGIVLRRICGKLEEVFEEVYTPGNDAGYSFATGIREHGRLFAFYTASRDYQILNTCLKEELYNCLKQGTRLRVILDEMIFENEEDELLRYLLREKMQGRIELMFLAQNPVKWLPEAADLAFANVVMFPQQTPAATDVVSERLFSTYQHYFPAPTAGTPPHLLFTFQKAVNWQIQSEQRLRVQSNDLYQTLSRRGTVVDYLAVKTMESDNIFLVPTEDFMQSGARYLLTNKEGNLKNET